MTNPLKIIVEISGLRDQYIKKNVMNIVEDLNIEMHKTEEVENNLRNQKYLFIFIFIYYF